MSRDYDLFVIGGGSAGVRCARIAAGHGARVGIAEERFWGGTCVNIGCVPKKLMVMAAEYGNAAQDSRGFGWNCADGTHDWHTLIANKDIEISRLSIDLRNVRTAVADMESRHAAGLELLRVRQDQVRSANENLDTAKAAHQAGIHSQEQALKAMLERLRAAEVSLQECIAKNEALTRDNVRLQSALAQVAVAEEKQANLAAQNRQLEEQASRLNSNLAQRHDEMDSVIAQLTSLRVDESALLCVIQTLRQNEQTEQQRFDHARKTHAQIDQQAAAKHAELESALEYLRGQISKLEAYLTSLEVWRDDMNEHYTRLATMPEDSAEALKLWREIHRKKEGIAAQLPSQTGIKPRFNTQVQVVPRGQRLS